MKIWSSADDSLPHTICRGLSVVIDQLSLPGVQVAAPRAGCEELP